MYRKRGLEGSVEAKFAIGYFFFNDTATTEIYTLSLHDALPISMIIYMVAIEANETMIDGLTELADSCEANPDCTPDSLTALEAAIAEAEANLALYQDSLDRKSTRLNSSHIPLSRMPSSA